MDEKIFQSSGKGKEGITQSKSLRSSNKTLSFTPKPSETLMFSIENKENELTEIKETQPTEKKECSFQRRKFQISSCKEIEKRHRIALCAPTNLHQIQKGYKACNRLYRTTDNLSYKKNKDRQSDIKGNNKRDRIYSVMEDFNKVNDEDIRNLTNTQEEIADFYEYTEECFQKIIEFNEPTNEAIESSSVTLPFTLDAKKRLAVFDLDETLIHCDFKNKRDVQHIIDVPVPSKGKVSIGINIRPHWKKALDKIKKKYHIVVYTASHQSYGNAVIDYLDPEKEYFEYRLFRNNCIQIKEDGITYYIKDLRVFKNVELKDIVIIDNSVLSFAFQLNNGLPILPYYSGNRDIELIFLSRYLESIASCDDLRNENAKYIKLSQLLREVKEMNDLTIEEEDQEDKDMSDYSFNLSIDEINGNAIDSTRIKEDKFNLEQVLAELKIQFTEGIQH